ncbi:MAG: NAD-dependent epimerase/dehydratase family protein [Acidobacteriia bacterium]|nr:NAD-dependent epimerase/dehydratase family protein [Terriglobia bacterium]
MPDDGNQYSPTLVTGASGFIGRRLIQTLLQMNRQVIAFSRRPEALSDLKNPVLQIYQVDLEDPGSYVPYLEKEVTIFHLAAVRSRPGSPPELFRKVNEMASLKLARASVQVAVRKFVYVSSAVVFGPSFGSPVSEAGGLSEGMMGDCYIASRVRSLRAMQGVMVNEGLPLVTLCPTIVFGPDHPSSPNKITSHIRRIVRSGRDVVVAGGVQKRNLVFVDDVIRGMLLAEKLGNYGEIFILGGEDISHRAFDEMILTLSGRKPPMCLSIPPWLARTSTRWLDRLLNHERCSGYESAVKVLTAGWQYSSQKAARVLGYEWNPIRSGLLKTISFIKGEVQ